MKTAKYKSFFSVVMILISGSFLSACANLPLKPTKVTLFGEANSDKEAEITEKYDTLWSNNSKPKENISIYIDTIPEGLEYRDGLLTVQKGYNHIVIGSTRLDRYFYGWDWAGVSSPMFPKYRTQWKKPFCYWQRPLSTITLGLWGFIPTHYPCDASEPAPVSKKDAEYDLKKMAEAMDSDLVIASYSSYEDKVIGTNAFFVKMDPSLKNKKLKTTPANLDSSEKKK